jgi:choline dehydrogenase-like flavoprotein
MLIDARTVERDHVIETDVCVVGAGLAGITLARECIGADFRVCLLEGGGFEPDEATLALSKGENVGLPYDRLDGARHRAFGGNSNIWSLDLGEGRLGVRLRPLDAIDFEHRDWMPNSGWPFDLHHLDPYYRRAQRVFQLGPYAYEAADWGGGHEDSQLLLEQGRVESKVFQFARADPFYDQYRTEILRAPNVTGYLHANVLGLGISADGRRVDAVRVACVPGGTFVLLPLDDGMQRTRVAPLPRNEFSVSAKIVVLATGGTENPRLLLISNDVHPNGIGNRHDLVGRYFMEHPHLWSGKIVPNDQTLVNRLPLYGLHDVAGTPIMAKLALSEEVRRRERLMGYCVSIHPHTFQPRSVESAGRIARALRRGRMPGHSGRDLADVARGLDDVARAVRHRVIDRAAGAPAGSNVSYRRPIRGFRLNHMSEQAPNPESRITLSDSRDALGARRVRLHWRLDRADIRTIVRSQEIIDQELRRAKVGHLQIDLADDTVPDTIHGGWHHMGTTRMQDDPKRGVVDRDTRVHGTANLYVAGSSVFPTGGYANPSLTICALAIRLADHIKMEMHGTRVEMPPASTTTLASPPPYDAAVIAADVA